MGGVQIVSGRGFNNYFLVPVAALERLEPMPKVSCSHHRRRFDRLSRPLPRTQAFRVEGLDTRLAATLRYSPLFLWDAVT